MDTWWIDKHARVLATLHCFFMLREQEWNWSEENVCIFWLYCETQVRLTPLLIERFCNVLVKPEPLEWYAMVRTNGVNQSELETEIYTTSFKRGTKHTASAKRGRSAGKHATHAKGGKRFCSWLVERKQTACCPGLSRATSQSCCCVSFRKMKTKKPRCLLKRKQEKRMKSMCVRWKEFQLCAAGTWHATAFFTLRSYNSRSDWLIGRVVFLREVNAVTKYHLFW